MNVSVVIPNYNGRVLLEKNLQKVIDACVFYKDRTKENIEIIVVDDSSLDNSLEFLHSVKTNIPFKVIAQDKNKGFAPTINHGVSSAAGEVIVLLNSDVTPQKEFLLPLIAHFSDIDVFAVGCLEIVEEGAKKIFRGRGLGKWRRGLLVHRRGEVDKPTTLWVSGGSGAYRKSMWDSLGGFDPLYAPFYYEDIDLSYRAAKVGYKIIFESKSKVMHEHAEGAILKNFNDSFIKKTAYRNQLMFSWKNAFDASIILSQLIWIIPHILMAIKRGDFDFIFGFLAALKHIPNIVMNKLNNRKLYIISDNQIIKNLYT